MACSMVWAGTPIAFAEDGDFLASKFHGVPLNQLAWKLIPVISCRFNITEHAHFILLSLSLPAPNNMPFLFLRLSLQHHRHAIAQLRHLPQK